MRSFPSLKTSLVILVLLIAIFHGQSVVSYAWSNAGLLVLSQKLATSSSEAAPQAAYQAEALLRRAIAFAFGNRSAWRGLGYVLVLQKQEDEAITAWRKARLSTDALLDWGKMAEKQSRWDAALKWYMRAASLSPQSSMPWYHLAQIYEQQETWSQALAAYENAIIRDNWGTLPARAGDAYARMALIYYSRLVPPRFREALVASEEAIRLGAFYSPWSESYVHYLRGRVLWQDNRREEAREEFYKAVRAHESHVEAHYWLGVAHYAVAQDANQAEVELKAALELRPNNKWPYMSLAQIYSETGRREEAIKAYQQALAIDPSDIEAQKRLQKLMLEK